MDPEVDEHGAAGAARAPASKKQHILQRRLKSQISESRMLEVLERQLQGDRVNDLLRRKRGSNQEEDATRHDNDDDDEEEELVCVSTMVAVAPSAVAASDAYDQRVCGVLKTVRCMHRQRASENQSDHASKLSDATAHYATSERRDH